MSCGDIFLGLIAILFPPIAVWIKSGICSCDSLINILLCMLGYLPGLLHAWYIIARNPERNWDYETIPDAESQRVTYYYIRTEPAGGRRRSSAGNYGTAQGPNHRPAAPPLPPKPGSNATPQQTAGESSRPAPPPPTTQPTGPAVGAGSHEPGAPPSYSEVVKGDNKIQTQD
ncbi:hypothetical protein ABEF95_007310 [Exophiala dermatitidis]